MDKNFASTDGTFQNDLNNRKHASLVTGKKLSLGFVLLILLILALPSLFLASASSTAPAIEWVQRYDCTGRGEESARGLVETSDGGYAFTATKTPYSLLGIPHSMILFKTDASGAVQWQKEFTSEPASGLIKTSDGGYVLPAGNESGSMLIKVDSSGNKEWNVKYPFKGYNIQMIRSSDGGYALTGTEDTRDSKELWFVKTDSSGTLQWSETYSLSFDLLGGLTEGSDGGYVIVGRAMAANSAMVPSVTRIVKLDGSGTLVWSKTLDSVVVDWVGQPIVRAGDGGYVLIGASNSSTRYAVIKLNANGDRVWNQTYDVEGGRVNSVMETRDGGLAFGGSLKRYGEFAYYIWMAKADASGNIVWQGTYGNENVPRGLGYFWYIRGSTIIESKSGGFVVAGAGLEESINSPEYYLTKTKPTSALPPPTATATPTASAAKPTPNSTPTPTQQPTTSPSDAPQVPEQSPETTKLLIAALIASIAGALTWTALTSRRKRGNLRTPEKSS